VCEYDNLIFTNGCFDLIHVGHIRLLEFAASLGTLVVGLNSDASVKRLKGPSRPINPASERKEVLKAIKYVSEVVIFEEDTPLNLIKKLSPRVLVKGGDYKPEDVIGYGITEIIIFPLVQGVSSSILINRTSGR
jgi:D-beta-D-heptose 7-phosphate kinase/D-beta-D-heptose 1-phosphate adenosyltransferase